MSSEKARAYNAGYLSGETWYEAEEKGEPITMFSPHAKNSVLDMSWKRGFIDGAANKAEELDDE